MKIVNETEAQPRDRSSRWVTLGMVALALLGIVTVFGSSLWSMVIGDVSIQNP